MHVPVPLPVPVPLHIPTMHSLVCFPRDPTPLEVRVRDNDREVLVRLPSPDLIAAK